MNVRWRSIQNINVRTAEMIDRGAGSRIEVGFEGANPVGGVAGAARAQSA
jgi:hypothetical protein